MALNLLQICTRALDDISSFNIPDYIIGNTTDDTARTLLAAAFKVGEELVRDYDWQEFSKTGSVTTVNGTSLYDFESDYDRMAPDTLWNNTEARYMRGHTTRRRWAAITNSSVYSPFEHEWRLKGGQIQVYPTPSSAFTFNYEYLSNIYCTSSVGADRADGWTADTDLPKLPADIFIHGIRYYFSDSKNLPGALKAAAEYDAVISSRHGKNTPSQAVNHAAAARLPGRCGHRLNIPESVDVS